ncbi:MAG: hypothetical protein HN742_41905 [Lentisphaerae bacterium]|jgi:hypothetical protein|nr:hypothetical protein [Lentisphaerota bacterium]MBT4818024.1 hypothetical protein [Lentisphaerota bacterium]MBT5605877.1 hypothetical protein [Lentisphaerota bacterium]MBT7055269.1 hypothetical protein [Lentisphaerota bacterium]MBT7848493.1 hypothetical protein [Lentisphaerota bacterium]
MNQPQLTAAQHQARLQNVQTAENVVRSCLRTHRVGRYLPGQVTYNVGDYPVPFSIRPTEYDDTLLASFAEGGVELVQLHEEWNDSQRVLGADKFTSHDPEGLRAFIDLAHSYGIGVMLYTSTGFFEATDPEFQPVWATGGTHLVELYFDYARCSPACPEWRAFILPRLERILDEYDIDGLYNDVGYHPVCLLDPFPDGYATPGPETETCHSAFVDLVAQEADLVHSRGGVYKVHVGGAQNRGLDNSVYDYLWVGEGVVDLHGLREATKDFSPYVVPCLDQSHGPLDNEELLFLHSVPYMQFPLRVDGRPLTGERGMAPGMSYRRGLDCWWTRHMHAIRDERVRHPDGPYSYGWWDSHPGRAGARDVWLEHLRLYRPMVTPGTRVWLELQDGDVVSGSLPASVIISLFVNDETYLVIANVGSQPQTIHSPWVWRNRRTDERLGQAFTVEGETLLYLSRDA